ncbi:MAG: hypothetical protein RMJ88_16135 [Thermogemmata sp.]|nr:hypothetical protein [Thermogemmata sp.]
MSFMFEVIYRAPADTEKEKQIASLISSYGGMLDCREEPDLNGINSVVLTYEFQDYDQAYAAASRLREQGLKVDGPYDYGP